MSLCGAPAAPRAVGRGGAREQAQFSPQAETELSGLCDDDNGGRIPRGSVPLREQNPPCQLFAQFFALFDCIIIWSFLADEAFTV